MQEKETKFIKQLNKSCNELFQGNLIKIKTMQYKVSDSRDVFPDFLEDPNGHINTHGILSNSDVNVFGRLTKVSSGGSPIQYMNRAYSLYLKRITVLLDI